MTDSFGNKALDCYLVNKCGINRVLCLINFIIFLAFTVCYMFFFIFANPDFVFLYAIEASSLFLSYFFYDVRVFYLCGFS